MHRKLTALAGAVTVAGALAFAGPASAAIAPAPHAVIGGVVYTDYLAGYATSANGGTHMDDVRAVVSLPSQASAIPAVPNDTLVVGVAQQQSETAPSATDGIGCVWNDTAAIAADPVQCQNAWALAYGTGITELPGSPIPPPALTLAQQFDPVLLTFGPVCHVGVTSYIECHYSKRTGREQFFAGPAWNQRTEYANVHLGYQPMLVAGAGLDSTHGSGATADLNTGTVASFARARVTTRTHANRSLDSFNVRAYEGTLHGGAPSVANPLTLTTSGITAAGSSFFISAP